MTFNQLIKLLPKVNEGLIYNILMFPCLLLIFYPAVFGIQNDEDSRILEILFGIPDYRYKVWGVRLLMIYVVIFAILIVFSYIAILLLYPINPFHPMIWEGILIKNRIFLFSSSLIWMMIGLLNLQKREKFV